ncbi:MAG: hypothetical protein CMC96_03050 [Flavobacteriales bacterium]|nr:hypothetical protein [Flavobacteriales bacterium]|tara:strand:+ start:5304 stop:5531 length:228 start_codon:yes stop_codon:yes gene_type:complete
MAKKKKEKDKEEKRPNQFLKFTGMAAQMAITILIGVFGGIKVDEYFELSSPIFTLVFSLLSVAAAMYFVIKDLNS